MLYLRELFALVDSMTRLTNAPMQRRWSAGSTAGLAAICVLQSVALVLEVFLGSNPLTSGLSMAVLALNLKGLFAPMLVTCCLIIWMLAALRMAQVIDDELGLPSSFNPLLDQAKFILMIRQAILPLATIAFLSFHPSWFSEAGVTVAISNSIQHVTTQVMLAFLLILWASFAAVVSRKKWLLVGAILLWSVLPSLGYVTTHLFRHNLRQRFEFLQWDWSFAYLLGWAAACFAIAAFRNNRPVAGVIAVSFLVSGVALQQLLPLVSICIPRSSAEALYSQRDAEWAIAADVISQSSSRFMQPFVTARVNHDGSGWIRGNVPMKWSVEEVGTGWVYTTPLLNAAYLVVLLAVMLWLIPAMSCEQDKPSYNQRHANRSAL